MTTFLSEVASPTVGLQVKSFWRTRGRVTCVREMRPDETHRWAARHAGELVVTVEWEHGEINEEPLPRYDEVRVVA